MKTKFILLLFIMFSLISTAQKWTLYNEFNTAKKLGSYMVYAIAIDSLENKWFGTLYGITEYDGSNWTTYRTNDGLADNCITCIAIDAGGTKWFGTINGVSQFDGIHWVNYTTDNGLVDNNIRTIAIDTLGNKWFGTASGISKFDGINWITYIDTTAKDSENNDIYSSIIDKEGTAWFGTAGGLLKFDGITWIMLYSDMMTSVESIAIDSLGNKWFGANGKFGAGVYEFDGINWNIYTKFSTDMVFNVNSVHSIIIDVEGNKWFGTDSGVYKFDGSQWTHYSISNGLAGINVCAINIDEQDTKWFGTIDGVSEFDGTDWTTYKTDGMPNDKVRAVVLDSKDKKWFILSDLVAEFDGIDCNILFDNDSVFVNTIAIDNQNNIWLGTNGYYGGVYEFDGTKWTTYNVSDGLADRAVNCIAFDSLGNKWFGTESGISIFDGKNWTTINMSDGLISNYIAAITIDAQNVVWIGYGTWAKGITKVEGQLLTNYIYDTPCGVTTIAIDSHNNKWFGLYGAGVLKFDGINWTGESLIDNNIMDIAVDIHDNIWVGSCGWVSKFNGSHWDSFNLINAGLDNYCVTAIAIDDQDNKWFTTWGGIVKFEEGIIGIENQTLDNMDNNLSIYPNPSVYQITVLFPKHDTYTITVTDLTGKSIIQSNLTGERTVLQIADLDAGIYLLSLKSLTNGNTYKNKIVISR